MCFGRKYKMTCLWEKGIISNVGCRLSLCHPSNRTIGKTSIRANSYQHICQIHSNDTQSTGLLDRGAEVLAGVCAQLSQHLCRDLLRCKLLAHHGAVNLHFLALEIHLVWHLLQLFLHFIGLAANKALHWVEGVLWIHHRLQEKL